MSLDNAIQEAVTAALTDALRPYLKRLADPEPLVYSVPEAAHVLRTSTNTIRRLVDAGVLPIVPHMGQRVLIPRTAVVEFVESGEPAGWRGQSGIRPLDTQRSVRDVG
jgi:excisionase family DNA binding protein